MTKREENGREHQLAKADSGHVQSGEAHVPDDRPRGLDASEVFDDKRLCVAVVS